jgi:hypothetical protein
MLEENLKKIIPKELKLFPKINRVGSPYNFNCWDWDKNNKEPILRYWFWNKENNYQNKKRLFLKELESLIQSSLDSGYLTRSDFNKICFRTYGDGSCGFSVIIAIFEHLEVIQKIKPGTYSLINERKIRALLY